MEENRKGLNVFLVKLDNVPQVFVHPARLVSVVMYVVRCWVCPLLKRLFQFWSKRFWFSKALWNLLARFNFSFSVRLASWWRREVPLYWLRLFLLCFDYTPRCFVVWSMLDLNEVLALWESPVVYLILCWHRFQPIHGTRIFGSIPTSRREETLEKKISKNGRLGRCINRWNLHFDGQLKNIIRSRTFPFYLLWIKWFVVCLLHLLMIRNEIAMDEHLKGVNSEQTSIYNICLSHSLFNTLKWREIVRGFAIKYGFKSIEWSMSIVTIFQSRINEIYKQYLIIHSTQIL